MPQLMKMAPPRTPSTIPAVVIFQVLGVRETLPSCLDSLGTFGCGEALSVAAVFVGIIFVSFLLSCSSTCSSCDGANDPVQDPPSSPSHALIHTILNMHDRTSASLSDHMKDFPITQSSQFCLSLVGEFDASTSLASGLKGPDWQGLAIHETETVRLMQAVAMSKVSSHRHLESNYPGRKATPPSDLPRSSNS